MPECCSGCGNISPAPCQGPTPSRVIGRSWAALAAVFTFSALSCLTQFVFCIFANATFMGAARLPMQVASIFATVFSASFAWITWRQALKLRRLMVQSRRMEQGRPFFPGSGWLS
jgi:hypothetical protein